ncbi:permease-like cell division protein FtsX [Jeongeupia wiesaeckerbachi]|uniref:permease-like cell division protein FtsX n=1 Tax=Jeongeupia wiesaeckerbachi TaxID=3051218 RepID=UPI003D805D98
MKHWFRLHALALSRTLGALLRQPLATVLHLAVIGLVASLPLGLYLVLSSIGNVTAKMPVEPQLTVFLKPEADVGALRAQLAKDGRLAQTRFVPKDDALKAMEAAIGSGDLLAGLPDNPLPDAFVLTARRDVPAAQLTALEQMLLTDPGVDTVQLDSAWAARLEKAISLGRHALQVVVLLLAVALVLVTGNAIRMQILTRREEIEVAKLIGATDSFIRRPFHYSAAIQGVFGGLVGCGIAAGAITWLNPAVGELAAAYGQPFALALPGPAELALVCATTMLLCLMGAWFAVWRHLRRYR